uniref:DUF4292 domain-containing protein n=1 Tax=Brugia timori TaxID=42155 RepID=A0A0R3QIM6_9BILA
LDTTGFIHTQSATTSPHMQSFINSNYNSALIHKAIESPLYDTAGKLIPIKY